VSSENSPLAKKLACPSPRVTEAEDGEKMGREVNDE